MMTSPPFMSITPGPLRCSLVDSLKRLKGVVGLEDRVEVADQEKARASAWMVGDEMAGALERRPVDPPRPETQPVELRPKDIADLAHPREILRAAVDVDDFLQQRKRLGVAGVDGCHDGLLGR